jgi:pimeloyl-ACP methyl ester carboxylesterase
MPLAMVNGIKINFDSYGSGEPVVLIAGTGSRGRDWAAHQIPAMTAAGYRVITMDNRGVPPSDTGPEGFSINDMVKDTLGLIDHLGIHSCRIVGYSLGGIIVLESLLTRPDLFSHAVVMGTRGRTDALRAALSAAWSELYDSGLTVPAKYLATVRATQYLSPRTMSDERLIRDWLDIFELAPLDSTIVRAQRGLDLIDNRLPEYRKITSRCLVISFQDDLVVPPFFGREIVESIPGCKYEEVPGCGHYGHLEQPDVVNSLIINFLS